MRNIIYFVIFAVLSGVSLSVSAEPMPWGIAVNETTRECASFWGGDEFTQYLLPEGWRDFYPFRDQNNGHVVRTLTGSCYYKKGEEEECCRQLGFSFVRHIDDLKAVETEWARYRRPLPGKEYGTELLVLAALAVACAVYWIIKKRKRLADKLAGRKWTDIFSKHE